MPVPRPSNHQCLKRGKILEGLPEETSNAVHVQGVYASRGVNPTTNARDNVFADGYSTQLISVSGSPSAGYLGTFRVGVPA